MVYLAAWDRWLMLGIWISLWTSPVLANPERPPAAIVPSFRSQSLPVKPVHRPLTRPLTRPLPQRIETDPKPTTPQLTPLGQLLEGNSCPGCSLPAVLLRYSYLPGANLSGGMLQRADLSFANLAGANLAGANLVGADLSFTNLTGANLTGANLSRAVLIQATLAGANLSQVTLADALLLDATIELDSSLNLCRATLADGQVSTQGCPPAPGVETIAKPTTSTR